MKRYAVLLAIVAIPSLALASPAHLATIEAECGTQLNLPPAGCACIKGKEDKVKQREVMQGMTVAELTEAGMFMTTAPAQCGNAQ